MSGAFNVGESRGIVPTALVGDVVPLSALSAMKPITSYSLVIPDDNGRPMLTVHPDGRMVFGENYAPDKAAGAFWEAVKRFAPDPSVQEFGAPLKARIDKELARGEKAEALLRKALAMYEDVVEGRIDGHAIGMLAGEIRGFVNTPEAS
ncbi:hypothetical protein [Streptomyces sp. NPDC001068]|uniref:hypothetical protein n=1 Tax=Streptomyces sp. NPDC001068 TaxID=3364544 RepID=UPI0036C14426